MLTLFLNGIIIKLGSSTLFYYMSWAQKNVSGTWFIKLFIKVYEIWLLEISSITLLPNEIINKLDSSELCCCISSAQIFSWTWYTKLPVKFMRYDSKNLVLNCLTELLLNLIHLSHIAAWVWAQFYSEFDSLSHLLIYKISL